MNGRRRALLVEDDLSNRLTFGALLEDAGFVVVEASDLAEARARIAHGPFDAAIVDVNLRDGRGPAIFPALRAAWPGITIATLTGDRAREPGADVALDKGNDPIASIQVLEDTIRRRNAP